MLHKDSVMLAMKEEYASETEDLRTRLVSASDHNRMLQQQLLDVQGLAIEQNQYVSLEVCCFVFHKAGYVKEVVRTCVFDACMCVVVRPGERAGVCLLERVRACVFECLMRISIPLGEEIRLILLVCCRMGMLGPSSSLHSLKT